jgi:hypothetical protein
MRGASAPVTISAMVSAPITIRCSRRLSAQGAGPNAIGMVGRMMGMNITTSSDDCAAQSTLVGRLPDQAGLSGILQDLHEKQYPVLLAECLVIG